MNFSSKYLTCCLSLLAVTLAQAAPVTTPYSTNFSTDPAGIFTPSSNYNGGGSGSIGWNSGNQTYQSQITDAAYGQINTNWSTVNASNLNASSSNFFLSTNFTITSSSDAGGTSSVGLGVSSATNFQTYSGANFYYGRFTTLDSLGGTVGQLRIFQSNGAEGISIATPAIFAGYTNGTTYSLSLNGAYSGNDLLLTFSITDGLTTQSVSATVANQAFANLNNFGYQHQITNWVSNTVQFDNFSLSAVPESASGALAVIACGLMAFRPRKRSVR